MQANFKTSIRHQYLCRAAVLLSLLIGICYMHTLDYSWHLDDMPNITQNPKIHMSTLSMDSVFASFFASPVSDRLYRPVAMLSFALNWCYGSDNVTGYRLVNIAVHLTTGVFLFLTLIALLSSPSMKAIDQENAFFIALLATAIWAVHPIQIQAVTYIVQRMASLAALFYIMAIWTYISGRYSRVAPVRWTWFGLCSLLYVMAVCTKENTILLPVILVFIELIFFQDINGPGIKKYFRILAIASIFVLTCGLICIALSWDTFSFMDKYQVRSFSPLDRLLTQFRVIVFYLTQLLYPSPTRFSIIHDFSLSTSLISPWTTLPSLLIVFMLIGCSLWGIHKSIAFKASSFSILFFFINHIVESTILPLEMVFEHRNYLPSFFLFVPVAIGINTALGYYRKQNRIMFVFLFFALCCLLSGISLSTYIRNMDWKSEKSLWQDAMIKAPKSARPLHNLSWGYYSPTGQIDKAIALYERSLQLSDDSIGFEATAYFNIAGIYFSKLGNDEKAIEYAKKTLQIDPGHRRATYILSAGLARLGRYEQALKYLEGMSDDQSESANNLYLKGLLYLKTQQPEKALNVFRRCMKLSPNHWQYLREIGFSLDAMNFHDQAYWFFNRALTIQPNQPDLLMGLAVNRLSEAKPHDAKVYVDRWVQIIGGDNIESHLDASWNNPMGLPIPYNSMIPLISKSLLDTSKRYQDMVQRLMSLSNETWLYDSPQENQGGG